MTNNEKIALLKEHMSETGDYTIYSRKQADGSVKKYEFTKEELDSLLQCYTNDPNAKFYMARKDISEFWNISKHGTMVTTSGNYPCLLPPSKSGLITETSSKRREQYELSKPKLENGEEDPLNGQTFDPGTLVALTHGGNATPEAESLINEHGLFALKRQLQPDGKVHAMVELNHTEGYVYGSTDKEVEELRAYNCNIERTQFETWEEHNYLTFSPSVDAEDEKKVAYLDKADNAFGDIKKPMVMIQKGNNAGEYVVPKSFVIGRKGDDYIMMIDGKEYKIDKSKSFCMFKYE